MDKSELAMLEVASQEESEDGFADERRVLLNQLRHLEITLYG